MSEDRIMDTQVSECEVVRVLVWRDNDQVLEKEHENRRDASNAITRLTTSVQKGRYGIGHFIIEADVIDRQTKILLRPHDRVEFTSKSVKHPTPDKAAMSVVDAARDFCQGKVPMGRLVRALNIYDLSLNPSAPSAERD